VQQSILGLAELLSGKAQPALKTEKASWMSGIFSRR